VFIFAGIRTRSDGSESDGATIMTTAHAIDLETKHVALNNNHNLFLMPGPLDEIRSSKINRETALSHAESSNFGRKRYIRQELRSLIAV
jgi:hypothetical protein